MNWTRTIGFSLAAIVALAGATVAMTPKPTKVELGQVERGAMQVTVEASGKTRVRDRFVVAAPVSGQLERVDLRPGDPVSAGQLVATIAALAPTLLDARSRAEAEARVSVATATRAEAEAAVERARVAREQADLDLLRVSRLAESNVVPPETRENAQFAARSRARELAAAEASVQSARRGVDAALATLVRGGRSGARAGHAEVLAPAKGRVLRVLQQSEGPVQAGTPLIEVGDPAVLELTADFLTTDAVRIRPGAVALLDQYGIALPLHGKVRLVEPSAFTKISALGVEEQRVNVLVDPAQNPGDWSVLGDGYQVQVRVVVWQAPSAIKIPLSALFRTGGTWSVFAVSNGKAALRVVQIGQRSSTEAELLDGLVPAETVILHPSDKIDNGSKVISR